MTNVSNGIDLLQLDKSFILDNTTNNRHFRIETPISVNLIPVKSDISLHSNIQTRNRLKTESKKRPLNNYNEPITRSHSKSLNYHDFEAYHRHHHHAYHHHQQQQTQSTDGCDMRFFIIRHGERVDRYFGSNWFMVAFDQYGHYRPYHINLPPSLPSRSNKYFWALDTPLTRNGLDAAHNVGQVLSINNFQPNYVYSSPAMRCILTTHHILKGLGLENKVAIRIEPGLLELGAARFGTSIFLKPIDWHNYGVNVDLTYRPIMKDVPPFEHEEAYYLRSKYVIREIEQRHNNSHSSLLNILIVAHATSPDTLTWDLVGRQPNIYDLYTLSLNIGYLQMVITERQRQNKFWSLTQTPLQSTTLKWV